MFQCPGAESGKDLKGDEKTSELLVVADNSLLKTLHSKLNHWYFSGMCNPRNSATFASANNFRSYFGTLRHSRRQL